jgi:glutathionyl-hydroquinone reductase
MGMLVDGEWRTDWYAPDERGRFVRPRTRFHGRVSAHGEGRFRDRLGPRLMAPAPGVPRH